MNSNVVTDVFTSQLAAVGGVLVLAGILPFIASWMLDGVVQVLRSNGLKLFLMGTGFTVLVAAAGIFVLQYGLNVTGDSEPTAAVASLAQTILMFTLPLALIAFAIRTIKLLVTSQ